MKRYLFAGSIILITLIALLYSNQKPSIEVSAEANATSTVIVPPSTANVSHETIATSTPREAEPQTVIIYQTYQTTTTGSMIDIVKPAEEPAIKPAEPSITYVPTPVFTTVYVPEPATPVYQPIASAPVSESAEEQVKEPVNEPVEEPTIEAPFFSELPHYWIEERNNGRWIFFQATWSDGSKGKIVCNGHSQNTSVRSGLPSYIEEKNLADQIEGGSLIAEGRYVSCTFSVGDHGGVTANLIVE